MCRNRAASTRATAGPRPVASRTLAGPRSGISQDATLVKIAHGLIAETVGGDRDEISANDWTTHGDDNVVNSGTVISSNNRVSFIPGDVEDKNAIATYDPLGEHAGEVLVYAILAGHETEPEIDSVVRPGIIAMSDPADYDPANYDVLLSRYSIFEDPFTVQDDTVQVTHVGVKGSNRALPTVKREIGQRAFQILWAREDGEAAVYDGFAAQDDPSILTLSGHTRTTGMVGLHVRGSSGTVTSQRCFCFALWAVSGRELTVLDAPAGSRAVVEDAAGNELAAAAEAGGEIGVDMMLLGDQTWSIDPATLLPDTPWPDDAVTLRIEDAAGAPLAELTPSGAVEGCWGGDVYSYAECT